MTTGFQNNSIFWVEVEKIKPNPYQPRREFDETRLKDLAESIRQYGILQPLTVTRKENIKEDGGISVEYELIAGERRLRASKLASLAQVPVIIRSGEENDQVKLELAIVENLQREDINPMERAEAFKRLAEEFGLTHTDIAKKIGKSREYVSNSIRITGLPDEIKQAVRDEKITEGHARSILMLKDKPAELNTLFKEVVYKKLTVRETEAIARRVARDKIRKKDYTPDPEIVRMEKEFSDSLGTRVHIHAKDVGGQIIIDYFSPEDVQELLKMLSSSSLGHESSDHMLNKFIEQHNEKEEVKEEPAPSVEEVVKAQEQATQESSEATEDTKEDEVSSPEQIYPQSENTTSEEENQQTAPSSDEGIRQENNNEAEGVDTDSADEASSDSTPSTFSSTSEQEASGPEGSPQATTNGTKDGEEEDDLYSISSFTV